MSTSEHSDIDVDDDGNEIEGYACTHCGGEGTCDDGADPLGDCPDELHRCHACRGTGNRSDQGAGGGDFARLCEVAERNGLVVEIPQNPDGEQAVWVLPSESREFEIGETTAAMRVCVVGSPFMDPAQVPVEAHAGQLIQMLDARGYR